MPSVQRGSVFKKPSGTWAYRYRDENGADARSPASRRRARPGRHSTPPLSVSAWGRSPPPGRSGQSRNSSTAISSSTRSSRWTLEVLRWKLGKVTDAFGDVKLRELLPEEIGAWRMRIPEGHRFETTQAFRQILDAAMRWKLISENPAKAVPNPQPKRPEIRPFESWDEIEAVAVELGRWGAVALVAVGTGLRPEELFALEWRDIDKRSSVVQIRRAFTCGLSRSGGRRSGRDVAYRPRSRPRCPQRHPKAPRCPSRFPLGPWWLCRPPQLQGSGVDPGDQGGRNRAASSDVRHAPYLREA